MANEAEEHRGGMNALLKVAAHGAKTANDCGAKLLPALAH